MNKKAWLSLTVASAVLSVSLVGCGSSSNDNYSVGTVVKNFLMVEQYYHMKRLVKS